MNIRTRLRALILATLLPVAILGVAGAYMLVERERDTFERGVRDRVLALSTAIDAEVRAAVTPLEVLARSPSLARGDLGAFRAEAERALEARRASWVNIVVSDPDTAEMRMNLLVPPGRPLIKPGDAETILESARTRAPTVSQVAIGPMLERPLFAVRVPVVLEGKVKYVISAILETAVVARLVEGQSFPEDWAVAVLDGNYRFVARRPAPGSGNEFASESLKRALEGAADGWQRGRLLDGSEIYRAFRRSTLGRWSVSIAVPRSVVDQTLEGAWLLLLGFVGAVALGLWIAWRLASRLSQPIAALAAAAPALGRGEASALPVPGPVDEVRELSRALGEAALAIRDREERQRLAEQALRAADRAKDEFLAMLGHELRNPLASVSNATQLLKIARDQPAVLDNVSDILGRQVEHMTRLVDDLLEVGRLTGGKVRLERSPLDLARVAGALVETWQADGRFLHHDVRTDLQAAWVSADRARIEQIVSNLVDNALKYTPAGGRIEVKVRTQAAQAVLEVSDTGEGMAPELMARMFDLFVQGERGLARAPGGLGIGLTMAKRLVELHGGTIRAASAGAGKGATFTVALPAMEQPVSAAGAMAAAPPGQAGARRILVIEDNRDARDSLAALLRLHGHEVHTAQNGAEGIAMARSGALDFVLVDIGLPDIDGYEVARRLREHAGRGLRLVALTGYGRQEDRRRALAAGFDEHLAKPVELGALEALLRAFAAAA